MAKRPSLDGKHCQLSGFRDPTSLHTLAAAYAEQGRWNEATVAATNALRLLRNASDPLAQEIQAHLEAYRQQQPIRGRVNRRDQDGTFSK